MNDLAIGVRLAVGGGRTSLARFGLSAVGVGIAVAVLLLAASVGPASDARKVRSSALVGNEQPVAGVAPLGVRVVSTDYAGHDLVLRYVHPTGDTSPVPPGISALPLPGQMWVSPAMGELMAEPGSGLLRDRLPQQVVGTIDRSGVGDPGDLVAYVGADAAVLTDGSTGSVYSYGRPPTPRELDPAILLIILVGLVALLTPVFIFTAASTRIAGAERDRRLSALRLVGSGSTQVRRIAAAEALVSAVAGLVLGTVLFLLGRQLAGGVTLFGAGAYPEDLVPEWWLAALVVLVVPVLAVLTAQFALRRTIIEPLGVVRFSKPVKRRVVWRLALVALGVALLVWHGGVGSDHTLWAVSIASGAALVLVGVPVLLPWVVERSVSRMRGGPTSWQLAIRRLQLDSGTSARVVGGVAVVLAGAIALQGVLASFADEFDVRDIGAGGEQAPSLVHLFAEASVADDVQRRAVGVAGVRSAYRVDNVLVGTGREDLDSVSVLSCASIAELFGVRDCAPGQLFSRGQGLPSVAVEGKRLSVLTWDERAEDYRAVAAWTVPAIRPVPPGPDRPQVNSVFAAAGGDVLVPEAQGYPTVEVEVDPEDRDAPDRLYAAVGPLQWRVYGFAENTATSLSVNQETYLAVRRALLGGSVFTLLLAGVSLLVLALEHIRERRRPLAVLAASGVPTGALARSLLWQIAVPIGLGVVIAVGTGVGLSALVLSLSSASLVVDWAGILVLTASAAVLGLLVSAVTLPFLRGATRLTSLRTE
ncbi:hypothetical protein BJP25_29795 [Actinokineospora bangkokensis]|uniref:ABC3 transporter permease C-terminal domain-containing protein n=1 Tax=Actinokineospora bangkokensis TaxID=1193682 RepID=A0A1Q9LGK0_9PSEU|nr:hypothetical protein BJP25_29795 [Actinokineospora bangkokensis]